MRALPVLSLLLVSCARLDAEPDVAAHIQGAWRAPVALSVAPVPVCDWPAPSAERGACDVPPTPETLAELGRLASQVAQRYPSDSSVRTAHTLALLQLAASPDSAALDQSIALLRAALATSDDAAIGVDLSAGLLLRFASRPAIGDVLEAAELLLAVLDDTSREPMTSQAACANFAIVLERLGVHGRPRTATTACSGAWRESPVSVGREAVHDTLATATDGHWPEFAFDHVTVRVLPALGRALQTTDSAAIAHHRAAAEQVRDALVRGGDDETVDAMLGQLRTADAARRARLARALELYGEVRAGTTRDTDALLDSIDGLTRVEDGVRSWAMLVRANRALTGSPRRPNEALALYAALRAREGSLRTVLGRRLAFNDAVTRLAIGDQVRAVRLLAHLSAACEEGERAECALGAAAMGASVAAIAGDDEQAERLLARASRNTAGPLRQAHYGVSWALRNEAERRGLSRTAALLYDEAWSTARALGRPELQAELVVAQAHGRVPTNDTAGLRADLDTLAALVRTSLSPADAAFYATEARWLDGAWRLATARPGARAQLDSAVRLLAADSNSSRAARPLLLRARAIAAEHDTVGALDAYDALLSALRRHAGEEATLFERTRLRQVGVEAGADAARLLLARGADAAAAKALDGEPFAGVRWPTEGVDVSRIDVVVRRLGVDTVLVWSRTGRGAWSRHVTRIAPSLVARARDALREDDLEAVHALLIAPVTRRVPPSVRALRVNAHGDLAALPWAALRDRDRGAPLASAWAVWYTDDIWRTDEPARPRRAPRVLVVDAAPRSGRLALRGAQAEVAQVAALWGARARTLADSAGAVSVRGALSSADVVHFAGHAVLDASRPERSYLALPGAGDARLTAEALATGARLSAELVVLAACDTRGAPVSGDADAARRSGLVSLANGLQSAGAAEVIGALWPIDDAATQSFMVDLHRALRDGASAAEALRQAQVASLSSADPARRSPRVWAAFQLLGR